MNNYLNFEEEFMLRKGERKQLVRFMREAINVEKIEWSDLTKVNLIKVADYIKERVTSNSAKTYFAVISSFLHCYDEEGIVPCKHPEEVLKCKKEPQQNVALDEEELKLIEKYYDDLWKKDNHQIEKDCLTLFLLEAFCGARSCDIENLSLSNIENNTLTYVSKKTHILAVIPEHHRLQQLLKRMPNKDYCCSTKVRVIKRVAKKVGINQAVTIFYHGKMVTRPKYEYLGTHTARRTFASILSAKGVPIAEIAQFMSHTNTSMTERYIKVDNQKVSPAALAFFNG